MRGLILAALGMLLLVAAASAQDEDEFGNVIIATANQEAIGSCITGANMAQVTTLDANLLGCDNEVVQDMFVTANGNDLIGTANFEGEEGDEADEGDMGSVVAGEETEDGEGEFFNAMNFVQYGAMTFNGTGDDNVDFQDIDLNANENCFTFGNFSQLAVQTADAIGCGNDIFQDTDAYVGVIPTAEGVEIGSGNDFTMANVAQASLLDACTVGGNDVDQHAEQDIFDNCVTQSSLTQEALLVQDVWGCDNTNDVSIGITGEDHFQDSLQVIENSDFNAGSKATQMVSLNEQVLGDDNVVAQFGETLIDDSCFTMGTATQSIGIKFVTAGCGDLVDQDATLSNIGNSITGGNLRQQSTINTNTMG